MERGAGGGAARPLAAAEMEGRRPRRVRYPAAAAFLCCDHFTMKLTTWLQSLSVSVSAWYRK
jgi:hypothetical protein